MKKIRKLFFWVLGVVLFSCTRFNTHTRTNLIPKTSLEVMWNLDFQAGFFNDTVSLKVDNTLVLDDDLIISESTSAYSGVRVTCYKGANNLIPKFLHVFTSKTNKVIDYNSPESDSIHLTISIKTPSGLESSQKVSIGKTAGKYIGASKSQGDAVILYIRQNNHPFLYY